MNKRQRKKNLKKFIKWAELLTKDIMKYKENFTEENDPVCKFLRKNGLIK